MLIEELRKQNDALRSFTARLSIDPSHCESIMHDFNNLNNSRASYDKKVFRSIRNIKEKIQQLKLGLPNTKDHRSLRSMIISVEKDIGEFRDDASKDFDSLINVESALQRDIEQFENLSFEAWSAEDTLEVRLEATRKDMQRNNQSILLKPPPRSTSKSAEHATSNLLHEGPSSSAFGNKEGTREKLEEQLNQVRGLLEGLGLEEESYGLTGGWVPAAHEVFMRVKTACKRYGVESEYFMSQIMRALPNVTRDEVDAHIAWMTKLDEIRELKKRLLVRFRDCKTRLENFDKAVALDKLYAEEAKKEEWEERRLDKQNLMTKKHLEMHSEVAKWREEKEEEERQQQRQEEERKKFDEQIHRERLQRRQEAKKKQIEKWKVENEDQRRKQLEFDEQKKSMKRQPSPVNFDRIKQLNEQLFQRKQALISNVRAKEEKMLSASRPSSCGPSKAYGHSPQQVRSRLFEPTACYLLRLEGNHEYVQEMKELRERGAHEQKMAKSFGGVIRGSVKDTRSRKIPNWRKP